MQCLCVWVFRTPYSTVFTAKVSAQVKQSFVRNKIVQHKIHSGEKKQRCRLQNYYRTCSPKNRTKAVNVRMLKDYSANAGNVKCRGCAVS
jgi:hypothetical protein